MTSPTPERPIRLVFVEDDPGLCVLVELLLKHESGIELVGTAQTGQDGLRLIKELQPDIVVTDFRLPDISGVELCNYVSKRYPKIRLLIVSGYERDFISDPLLMVSFTYVEKTAAFRDFPSTVRRTVS